MKKLFITTALFCGLLMQAYSQVTGHAYLQNQTDHSGIKVKFIAQSPSAKTDSTFTNVDGSYNANLKAGNYIIIFSKNQNTLSYNNGSELFINNPIQTLTPIYLDLNKVYLNGNISGLLSKDKEYIVNGNINVLEDQTLTIEAGTTLKFNDNTELKLTFANLIANGTKENPITFTSNNDNPTDSSWKGISFNQKQDNKNINQTCNLSYCIIEYCKDAFGGYSENNFVFKNNEIRNVQYCGGTKFNKNTINNKFHNFSKGGISAFMNSELSCNEIYDGNGFGLSLSASSFGGTIIYENISINNIKGVAIKYAQDNSSSGIKFSNNIIKNCIIGFEFTNALSNSVEGNIYNNTIINTSYILKYKFDKPGNIPANINFYNNLIVNTDTIIDNSTYTFQPNFFQFNLIYKYKYLINNGIISNIGNKITTNDNNDSIDLYANIYTNPRFIDTVNYLSNANSATYKVGKDGANIGYNPEGTCLEEILGIYVFADSLSITGTVHQGNGYLVNGKVIAYNISKQTSKTIYTDNDGNFKFDSLATGNYIIKAFRNTEDYWGYTNTYYPNKTDSANATILTLGGSILDIDMYMDITDGVANEEFTNKIKVSPNPFDNQLNIAIVNTNNEPITIQLLNMYGLVVKTIETSTPDNITLDTVDLKQGIYVLKVQQGSQIGMSKLIKN